MGVGREFPEQEIDFPPGSDLILYTDGLVEVQGRNLDDGIERLLEAVPSIVSAPVPATTIDEVIKQLTDGRHDDDIAFLHVHRAAEQT